MLRNNSVMIRVYSIKRGGRRKAKKKGMVGGVAGMDAISMLL